MRSNSVKKTFKTAPLEKNIIDKWQGDDCLISVLCTVYNHADYLKDTLNGFLNQTFDRKFEIIVHNDCSTDGSLSILEDYQRRYPNIIKVINQTENMYSQGYSPLYFMFCEINGDYIAICEGDDYWIDKDKLRKQWLALSNSDSMLSIHSAYCLVNGELKINKKWDYLKDKLYFGDIFRSVGQFSPTSSYFLKRDLLSNDLLKDILSRPGVGDVFVEIFSSLSNLPIIAINEKLSVYRCSSNDSWSLRNRNDAMLKKKNAEIFISDLKKIKKILNKKESKMIELKIAEARQDVCFSLISNKFTLLSIFYILKFFREIKICNFTTRFIRYIGQKI